jgi:hypothetical protein
LFFFCNNLGSIIYRLFVIQQADLAAENTRLQNELRDAREKIRNLELQVEALRANAREAAQALLNEARKGLL